MSQAASEGQRWCLQATKVWRTEKAEAGPTVEEEVALKATTKRVLESLESVRPAYDRM